MSPEHQMRILIVDDQQANVLLLEGLLDQLGYLNLRSTTDPREVLGLFVTFQPDAILLDLRMPDMDGFAILQQLRGMLGPDTFLPILVLTADVTPGARHRALDLGATDFLTKPFDALEVHLRIRNLLAARRLHLQVVEHNQRLDQQVRARTRELEAAQEVILARDSDLEATQLEILARLSYAAEYRDDDTGQHIHRVQVMVARLAHACGMSPYEIELLRQASALHDVGKIGIPDTILLKPGKFTPDEWVLMQTHTTIGAKILSGSPHRLLQLAEVIARSHHERWDGTGYPHGLRGEQIPQEGRIVAVADVFDALTSHRPYKVAWSVEDAIGEIKSQRGRQFDPDVVDAFFRVMHEEDGL